MMKRKLLLTGIFLSLFLAGQAYVSDALAERSRPLQVVATLPDYGVLVRTIGAERVSVQTIVQGDQDAHFIRPKPSFVDMVRRADLLITTGLDLEMWLPTVIDKSGNTRIRSGKPGYVGVARGITLLDKPKNLSRAEGGVHIYGNPHLTCSPINMQTVARNITVGLVRNDPEGKDYYQTNLKKLLDQFNERLFGKDLVKFLGGQTLSRLAEKGALLAFLESHKFKGKALIEYLGGWAKKMLPLRGVRIVTYHENWLYFVRLFELDAVGTVEPKPGIPPSPKHVAGLIDLMRKQSVRIILAANYFDHQKIKTVAAKVGAAPVIVSIYVGGAPRTDDYFMLVDSWIDALLSAAREKGVLKAPQKGTSDK